MLKVSQVADRLLLEITERGEIAQPDSLLQKVGLARGAGVKVGLDDYGAGDCREVLLDNGAFDFIKVDGQIIEQLGCPGSQADDFLEEVVYRASLMDAAVIAERVSGSHLVDRLLAAGVSLGQGHFLARPEPLPSLGDVSPAAARQM